VETSDPGLAKRLQKDSVFKAAQMNADEVRCAYGTALASPGLSPPLPVCESL
jgi:hypothetical protein